ncbi:rhomboid-related protein 4-like isoform X2 [Pomacea canaliculata]|uniref:rhomboid-related protein 4-like isoform X2 n=1 Tax=Pomacea canaliculata TaxID=400727 RepID=UPI000D73710B|nr:rhomboid-related protein 4-like isoform X2 [Pomacea canaliculata]
MARRGGLGLFLLSAEILNLGITEIPTVTLAALVGQVVIFLDFFPRYFPSAASVCVSSYMVWNNGMWKRLVLAPLYHGNDMHLYFNMISFLMKGRTLERKFGSIYFLWMLSVFTVLSSLLYVVLGVLLAELLDDIHYLTQCAIGFSGVVFALKVVTTHYARETQYHLFGFIRVPARMIYWVELLLIQILVPNVSFIGHLAGIIVGLLYIKGPLGPIMNSIISPYYGQAHRRSRWARTTGPYSDPYVGRKYNRNYNANTPYNAQYNRGYTGGTQSSAPFAGESQYMYQDLTGGLSEEEQLDRAVFESMQQPQSFRELHPDLDELRARRCSRFRRCI